MSEEIKKIIKIEDATKDKNSVEFNSLGFSSKEEVKEITFNNQKIEIKQYLPLERKHLILFNVLEESDNGGFYDIVKFDLALKINILLHYTNIFFKEDTELQVTEVYDYITYSGLFDQIIAAIPEKEYQTLLGMIMQYKTESLEVYKSATATIKNLIKNMNLDEDIIMDLLQQINSPEIQSILKTYTNAKEELKNHKDNIE